MWSLTVKARVEIYKAFLNADLGPWTPGRERLFPQVSGDVLSTTLAVIFRESDEQRDTSVDPVCQAPCFWLSLQE